MIDQMYRVWVAEELHSAAQWRKRAAKAGSDAGFRADCILAARGCLRWARHVRTQYPEWGRLA